MADEQTDIKTIETFFSYAHLDEAYLKELQKHLASLKWQGTLSIWHDRDISAGQEWQTIINSHLNTANLVLLLISSDFMASRYCFSVEGKRALERHRMREARVIPILLRPVHLEDAPFNHLTFLPTNRKPVTTWPNPDEAYQNIAEGISKVVKELLAEQWYHEGQEHYQAENYTDALLAYDRAIEWHAKFANAYNAKGDVFRRLERFEEALEAHEQAIKVDSKSVWAWYGKANVLRSLNRYEPAFTCYSQVTKLEPDNTWAWYDKGDVLYKLQRYDEALAAFVRAAELNPNNAHIQHYKGNSLRSLSRYEEALACYDRTLELDHTYMWAWHDKGIIFYNLGQYEEALSSLEHALALKHDNMWSWYEKGKVLYQLQRYRPAIEAYEKVIDFFENNDVIWALREAWVGKARSLKALSDQAFQKAQELGYTGEE
jgi:tetratricopeptide (TPR) repeat protein